MARTGAQILLSVSLLLVVSQAYGNLYIGCFREDHARSLPIQADRDGPMSIGKCSDLCTARNFMFFGVQFGKECWCGNSYGRYEERPAGECNMRCTGQDQVMCGGHLRNNVYTTDYVSGTHYLGCFADDEQRDLNVLGDGFKGTMTVKLCNDVCKSRGFLYFGLQHSDECYCGNSYGRVGARPVSDCHMRCKGDATAVCGGFLRNSVYATGLNPLPKFNPSGRRIRDAIVEKVRSMYSATPAGVVCPSCLISTMQPREVSYVSESFKLAELAARLSKFPAEAQEKLKVLQMGAEAKTTFESSSIHVDKEESLRSTFFGMAERVQDTINVGMVRATVFGRLIRRHNVYERQTCWKHWLFWVKCENRTIEEVRGYNGHEIRQIDTALMTETMRQFNTAAANISV